MLGQRADGQVVHVARHSGKLWLVVQRTGNGKTGLRVFGLRRSFKMRCWCGQKQMEMRPLVLED